MLKNKYKSLFNFSTYYKKYKKNITCLIIVMLLASSLGLLLPYFISKRLIGITKLNSSVVLLYSGVVMLIILFHHIFWYLWDKIASLITNKVTNDIRMNLTTKMVNTYYEDIKHKTSGYYIERINNDSFEVAGVLTNTLGTMVDSLTNVGFLILIYFFNYKIGLLFTLGIIILYVVDSIRINKDVKFVEKLKHLNENLNSKINETFKGIKDIKGLGINRVINQNTQNINNDILLTQMNKDKSFAFLSRIKTYIQYLIETSIIIYSIVVLIPNGKLEVVILLMIISYSGFMFDLVNFITTSKDNLIKGNLKAERLLEVFNDGDESYGSINKINNNSILINNLVFSFKDDPKTKIFDKFSALIPEKTTNLFIGSSGSGKSTLFGVLTKLYKVKNNMIKIGEVDINDLTSNALKSNICIINQEPFLINDTIYNNLKIVKPKATKEDIIKATKQANIYNEITTFENGFDFVVSENGTNLSGGQRQRIAIARALLKDSPILMFDEPTSALDKENQQLFLKTLDTIKNNKTILIIAHKFEDQTLFDNVIKID